jgi:hypothetical protein
LAVRRRRLCLADALPHSPIHRGIGGSFTPSTEKTMAARKKGGRKGARKGGRKSTRKSSRKKAAKKTTRRRRRRSAM